MGFGHDHGHAIHEVSRYGMKWPGTVRKIHVHAPRTKLKKKLKSLWSEF
jgi:hypothetical protein